MKFIKNITQNKTEDDSTLYHLHKTLAGPERARTVKRVHASELYSAYRAFCPREIALLDTLNRRRPDEFISAATRLTFDFGDMYADWLINKLADAGVAVGDWECKHSKCLHMYTFQKRPRKCGDCGHTEFKYIEHRFKSIQSGVSCGVDCLRTTKSGKYKAIEIKSIKKEEFSKLAGPLQEHKIRTNLYMRLIDDSNDPIKKMIDTRNAEIVYICKGGYERWVRPKHWDFEDDNYTPFKVFEVQRDDTKTEEKVQHAIRLKEFREGSKGIPLGICSSQWCPRAEVCSVRQECFSGKYKGTV